MLLADAARQPLLLVILSQSIYQSTHPSIHSPTEPWATIDEWLYLFKIGSNVALTKYHIWKLHNYNIDGDSHKVNIFHLTSEPQ